MSSKSSEKTGSTDDRQSVATETTLGRSDYADPGEESTTRMDEEGRSIMSDDVEPPSTARSRVDTSETDGAVTEDDEALAAKKLAHAQRKQKIKEEREKMSMEMHVDLDKVIEEEDDEISLLDRHDSELTQKQIIEKDIQMYDLLLSNEELMEMKDSKLVIAQEEEIVQVVQEEQEEEEETATDEQSVEEEEMDEGPEETVAPPEQVDFDDPDNIVNMMMQSENLDEDEVKLLFRQDFGPEQDTDTLLNQEGIVGITLSDETKKFLELEQDLSEWPQKWTWISWKKIKLHIYIYEDKSEFRPYYDQIKNYPDFAMLLGIDLGQQTGHSFFFCLSPEARNFVLNPPKKRKVFVDLKKKEEEAWDTLASITPGKWRCLGSDVEVDQENIQNHRPLLTVHAYRDAEYFGAETNLTDSHWPPGSENICTGFESKDPSLYPGVGRLEIDKAIQVNPPKLSTECQTGFSFKRNKMCQQEVQIIDPQVAQENLKTPEMETFFHKSRPFIEKALQQNEMLNIMADDYHNLKAVKGHEVEFNDESVLLQEYQTYADVRHTKGRSVTYMTFHPLLDEVVIMAFTEDVTFDKRIEFHSKVLVDPNFVLMWDLKEPSKPQLMFDAPSDVFSFMVCPSDPNLICGGCENGQVILWDCGRHYIDLRNRIQDRKRKESDGLIKDGNFLEKLKDSSEKYVCPLIPAAGISNLDSSHKRVVTGVHWLPPHVQLGKNGNLYDNAWGGRSTQFFSVAGDSSIRLWDIRVQKLGLEEFDVTPVSTIKINPWHHLDNNQWKFSSKYTLDDGNGTMYCTIISLSEGKIGDILVVESRPSTSTSVNEELGRMSVTSSDMGSSNVKFKDLGNKGKGKLGTSQQNKNSVASGGSDVITSSDRMSAGHSGGSIETKGSAASSQIGASGGVGGGGTSLVSKSLASGDADIDNINALAKRAGGMLSATNALTSFFAGTETGQVALIDWLRNKDGSINPDAAGSKVCQNMYLQEIHNGAITSISRSPFYHDLLLVVGGGTISIWKEKSGYPVLATLGGENFPWCGCWSITRPGVFFCGTREGSLQVWDLMDRSHAPVLIQQVSPVRICSIAIPKTLTQKKHFLAIGDSAGTLTVLIIPRYYTKLQSGENGTMIELMNREEVRMTSWIHNEENRTKIINQIWKDKRIVKTEQEINDNKLQVEARLSGEYQQFLEFQARLVGKLKKEEPELPTDDLDIDVELEALIKAAEEKDNERLRKLADDEDERENEEA